MGKTREGSGKIGHMLSYMNFFKLKKSLQPRVTLSWPSSGSNVPPTGRANGPVKVEG